MATYLQEVSIGIRVSSIIEGKSRIEQINGIPDLFEISSAMRLKSCLTRLSLSKAEHDLVYHTFT